MDVRLFEKVLASVQESRFRVEQIEYCGQGEPLINRAFREFVRLARKYFPKTCQRLITNANFDYHRATGGQPLDEIFISCDGVRQSSYQQYRVDGDVDLVMNFMRAAPRKVDGRRQHLIWKYILFEFNDSDREIAEAQQAAQDLQVDTLLFVFTHSKFKSQRFTKENAAQFPICYPNVTTNATPIHYQNVGDLPPLVGPVRVLKISRKHSVV